MLTNQLISEQELYLSNKFEEVVTPWELPDTFFYQVEAYFGVQLKRFYTHDEKVFIEFMKIPHINPAVCIASKVNPASVILDMAVRYK